ncbi:MAG TPA: hypothetical protein VF155_09910 [Candidatus Dormibacteraeota bacterium]
MNHPTVDTQANTTWSSIRQQWWDGAQRQPARKLLPKVHREAFLWSGIGVLTLAFFAELLAVNTSDSATCTGTCADATFVVPAMLLVVGSALIFVSRKLRRR